jgi:hypothetical protein
MYGVFTNERSTSERVKEIRSINRKKKNVDDKAKRRERKEIGKNE